MLECPGAASRGVRATQPLAFAAAAAYEYMPRSDHTHLGGISSHSLA